MSRAETERILRISGFDVPRTTENDDIAEREKDLDKRFAEQVGMMFAGAYKDALQLAEEQGNPNCRDCDNAMHLGLFKKACPICSCRPYCKRHSRMHVSTFHMDTEAYQLQMLEITKEFMTRGWMTGYHTRESSHTLTKHNNRHGTREGRNTGRSPWYDWANHLNLPGASVTTWRQGETQDDHKRIIAQIEEFKDLSGLRAYMWAPGSGITMFTAKRTDMDFLPEDPTAPPETQNSKSGFKFNYGNTPAKTGKRAKFATHAEGSIFSPIPSRLPYLNLPDCSSLKVQVRDTRWIGNYQMARGAGDGNGKIRRSAAHRRVLPQAGITKKLRQIIGIQPNIMGADFFIKGILLIRPDEEFPEGIDIIVDRDSISGQLLNETVTMGKIIPKRHKQNTRYIYIEPVMQAETVDEILDHQEMAETQKAISQRIDRETYKRALSAKPEITGQTEEEEIQEREREWDSWDKKENPHLSHALSTEFATGMTDIAAKAGGIWSDPLAVKRMAGGPHGHWDGKMKKASPMAGRMLSGEKVYLMHYFFAGTTAPQPGYARLIWDDRQATSSPGSRSTSGTPRGSSPHWTPATATISCPWCS